MHSRVDSRRGPAALLALWSATAWTQGAPAQDALTPAFSNTELRALPRDAWITKSGNLANQRYSPLTRIDRGNVAGLKAVWRTSLEGSGVMPRGSNPAEPLYHDGAVYIVTSANDVFALDADTGAVRWRHTANVVGAAMSQDDLQDLASYMLQHLIPTSNSTADQ